MYLHGIDESHLDNETFITDKCDEAEKHASKAGGTLGGSKIDLGS
jgi:hypothetical protein